MIVKECLVEILEEGIGETEKRISESSNRRVEHAPPKRSKSLDNISWDSQESGNNRVKNNNFEKNIKKVANEMTSDPILSSILADTAKTTLQEQVERHGPGGGMQPGIQGDSAARAVASSNPEDLFSEASQNWAALAFDD